MKKILSEYFFWSDNWCLDGNHAWFVDAERDILFQLNFVTGQCEFVKKIPNIIAQKFRLNPRCMKFRDMIVCMPDIGEYIWIYHLDQFEKIEISNPNNTRILINNFWEFEEKIYAVSVGLNQILEINIENKKIDNYYNLAESNIQIAGSIKVNDKIFIVSAVSNHIYEFDLKTKRMITHKLTFLKDKLNNICFDGSKFWLSGYNKAIYVWDKVNDTVEVIKNFPELCGIYDYTGKSDSFLNCKAVVYDTPVFKDIVTVGQYIWFIPFKTNKVIFVNKDTFEMFCLDIIYENETQDSLARNYMGHKYLLLYIREERYIGLFSFKNNGIFEIDSVNLRVNNQKYFLPIQSMLKIVQERILGEYYFFDRIIYQSILLANAFKTNKSESNNIGLTIYRNCVK